MTSYIVHMMSYMFCYHIYNGGYMINNQDVNVDRVDVLSDITSGCHMRYKSFDIMECSDVINRV